MKILTAETNLSSAKNINNSPVVRIYNSDSSATILTRRNNVNTVLGTYTIPPGKVIYCQKTYTDTLEGGAALKATGVGYSEELEIICLGNGGGNGEIVDTDLYVHYDFSNTDCWNRQNGTNTDDYTIHNLANDYNDGLLRSRTGTSDAFRNASDSPVIDFNSSDGGGCLEWIPSNNSSDEDDCSLIIPGSYAFPTSSIPSYNITTVSATDTNNLTNGIGTGAFTIEMWFKVYLDHAVSQSIQPLRLKSKNTSGSTIYQRVYVYSPGYTTDTNRANKMRILHGTSNSASGELISINGSPSSGAAWSNWNHLVYSRNSTSTDDTKIYLNNSLEVTCTDNANIDYFYDNLRPWNSSFSDNIPLRQGIFRFYRGKALTTSEVTQNWNAQKSRFGH